MKERPIIFSAPMVRAILAGAKTQTRRVVKPAGWDPASAEYGKARIGVHPNAPKMGLQAYFHHLESDTWHGVGCPYGKHGDRLWVREAWDFIAEGDPGTPSCAGIRYWADAGYQLRTPPSTYNPLLYREWRVRPPIHMPRWASRITLEVTGVRVERLQKISEADAIAEGVTAGKYRGLERAVARTYSDLWEQMHGPNSWAANPWVWVVEFKRLPA